MRFGAITTEIDAVQWTGDNIEEVLAFTDAVVNAPCNAGLFIALRHERGIEDWYRVPEGTWIARQPHEHRHHWPYHWLIAEDIFRDLYEEVSA